MSNDPNAGDPAPKPLRWDGSDPGWVEPKPEEALAAPEPDDEGQVEPTDDPAALAPSTPRPADPPRLAWDAAPPPPPPPPLFQSAAVERYPMRYEVEYPESLSRAKTLLRVFLIVPAALFGWFVTYLLYVTFLTGWIPVFVKRKYPTWLFAAGTGALAWSARFQAYGLLLTDGYPSFDAESKAVTLAYDAPPNGRLSRWRVFLWKAALIWPHLVVLSFLWLAVAVVTFIAWWAILATGRYPRGLFGFVTGVQRWQYRVAGYFASYNDRFPPYSLSADAGPGSTAAAVVSGVLGFAVIGLFAGLIAAAASGGGRHSLDVDYEALKAGRARDQATLFAGTERTPRFVLTLNKITDPEAAFARTVAADTDFRAVLFELGMQNRDRTGNLRMSDVRLRIRDGLEERTVAVALLLVDGESAPVNILPAASQTTAVRAYFIIAKTASPLYLDVDPPWFTANGTREDGARFRFP